jgi:hypothetical protein
VVLTHAHLEDSLRTLAETFLPLASEEALNNVPFVGTPGRPEKFFLGKLAKHRTKTVDELIRESVREHLDRSNFNNVTEIASLLQGLGIPVPESQKENLPLIDAMIQRRHLIVHRGDRVKSKDGCLQTQVINIAEVHEWMNATNDFIYALCQPVLEKRNIAELKAVLGPSLTRRLEKSQVD